MCDAGVVRECDCHCRHTRHAKNNKCRLDNLTTALIRGTPDPQLPDAQLLVCTPDAHLLVDITHIADAHLLVCSTDMHYLRL